MDSTTRMTETDQEQAQNTDPLLLSVPQTARLLGIGNTLCWEMVKCGRLPSVHFGRRVLIPRIAVERLAGMTEPAWPE